MQTLGSVVGVSKVVEVTLSLDTSIYASGDVLAAPQEIANFFPRQGGTGVIQSIQVLDKDDQGVAMDLVFMNATGSLGAENAAVGPTDAVADTIVGIVVVATGDYVDLVNSKLAVKANVGLLVGSSTQSLFVGAITRGGTPTHTASGVTLKIGVMLD